MYIAITGEGPTDYGRVEKALYYLPVFTCAFYIYMKNGNADLTIVETLYKELELSNKDEASFHKTLNSFMWSAARNRPNEKDLNRARNKSIDANYYEDYVGRNGYWQFLTQ